MNPSAIAKLRRTFILVAMASFLVVIAAMGATAAISNEIAIAGEANRTIDAILDADGKLPSESNFGRGPFHEEAMFGLRFFTVSFDDTGQVVNIDLEHVALVDEEVAAEAASVASDPNTITELNRYEDYFYKEGATDDGSMVVFLDCSIQTANARSATANTLIVCAVALVLTFLLVVVFSKRAIRPEVESARRQQQFMTNAGHELKTPIAVIRANTELTEMISGETEWTQSTMRQVERLDTLVRDLMNIARGQEQAESGEGLTQVDATQVVQAAVDSFKSVAQQSSVKLESDIAAGAQVKGRSGSIEQLTCLLVDNAIKYCDAGGTVSVKLTRARVGHGFTLVVSNDYAQGAGVDYRRFFDRFYREDESHENQKGYGIGLSVAQSICERYHGSIKASWKSGIISFTCVVKDA